MKKIILFIAVAMFVGGGLFYGGLKYGGRRALALGRQARMGQMGGIGMRGARGGNAGGFATGEIISKDDKSITIKLRDGGSKIIFVTQATPVTKSVAGSLNDAAVGEQVVVSGATNPDGSISAESIQIRLASPSNK